MYSLFYKNALTRALHFFIDDILLLAHTKTDILNLIDQLHQICRTNNLKIAPDKSLYILITVKVLGHEIGNNIIKPISSKDDDVHKLNFLTSKTGSMRLVAL